jgi:hypothetical protein
MIFSAGAIVIQAEGNFTDARRFQLSYAFDDTVFSDRICPKSRPRVGDATRTTLRRRLWASKADRVSQKRGRAPSRER